MENNQQKKDEFVRGVIPQERIQPSRGFSGIYYVGRSGVPTLRPERARDLDQGFPLSSASCGR